MQPEDLIPTLRKQFPTATNWECLPIYRKPLPVTFTVAFDDSLQPPVEDIPVAVYFRYKASDLHSRLYVMYDVANARFEEYRTDLRLAAFEGDLLDAMWYDLEHMLRERALPPCDVKGCKERGRTVLASPVYARAWMTSGEPLPDLRRVCPKHEYDLRKACGWTANLSDFPEWLHPYLYVDYLSQSDHFTDVIKYTGPVLRLRTKSG